MHAANTDGITQDCESMLEVRILGSVETHRGDHTLATGGPKQRMILAHLVMARGGIVDLDTLASDLWQVAPRDPAHAIQAHVSRLRSALSVEIERASNGYRIAPETFTVDAWEFEQLHLHGVAALAAGDVEEAIAALIQALSLWRGPPFGEFGHALGLQTHVARLTQQRASADADLIDAHLAAGRAALVIPELYGRLETAPLVERGWEQLMRALHLTGQRIEALSVYRRARDVMIDQLGIEPGNRLQALHDEILRAAGSTHPALPTPTAHPAPMPAPIVGRARELTELTEAWRASRAGLKVVTVTGDPGIGKTRLVADFVATLPQSRVLWTRCLDSLEVAYQPVVDLLRSDLAELNPDEVSARVGSGAGPLRGLIPELLEGVPAGAMPPGTSTPAIERQRIFDAVATWFTAAAVHEPLCLVIDDVHWADVESPHVLRHLMSVAADVPALIVMTYRDRETPTALAPGPFADFVRHSETVTHLPLTGLATSAISELLVNELDEPDAAPRTSAELVSHIADATGGNPLFVLELARQLKPLTDLSIESLPHELPAGLRAVIGARLRQLPPTLRDTLQVAAVLGHEFDPLLLGRLQDLPHEDVDDFLATATYARIIEEVPGARLRHQFTHAVVRAAVYEDIPRIRRAFLHLNVAEAMDQPGRPLSAELLHELAHHHVEAAVLGQVDRAIAALVDAGDASAAQRAPSAALELYERAWHLLPDDASPELRCDLLLRRGTVAFQAGVAYRDHLLDAGRLAQQLGDESRLSAAAIANNRGWYSSTVEVDRERVVVIEAALALCPVSKPESRSRLLALWAMENVRDPHHRATALSRSASSYALALTADDPVLLGEIMCHRYSVLYATFDDPHGCVELAERLYDFAHTRVDPELQMNAAIALAQATMMTGDFTTADRALERSRLLAEELRHPARTWMVRSWEAARTTMRGDPARGEAMAAEALDLGLACEQPDALTWFAGQLFALHHVTGRLSELVDAIGEQAVTHSDGIPAWRAAYALSLTTAQRHDEASAILDEFVEVDFARLPQDMLQLLGLCYLAEASMHLDRADAAKALYDHLLPHAGLVANNSTIDAGPVDMYLGMAALTAGDAERALRHLGEANAFCTRAGAPLWQQRVNALEERLALDHG